MADYPEQKRRKVKINNTQTLVANFMKWCANIGLILNPKITVREDGSCNRFGMIALKDLDEEECVFKIPRNVLLEPNTSSVSKTILEFTKDLPEIETRNKWLPLLLTLLYEHTNSDSKWRPYLDLVPSEAMLNQPIFWNEQEKEYLALIGLKDDVQSDETNIEDGYKQFVLPFMKKHREYFDPRIHTLSLYKRLAGFVMAYSFTDSDAADAKPAMVPMADILNHVSENNANLEFGDEFLSMVTTQPVEKGSEVYNTYGNLDNSNLLRSYGFIEESPNAFDEVEIPLKVFQDVSNIPEKVWESKLCQIHEQYRTGHVNIGEGVYFNIEAGCSWSGQTLYAFFQILHHKNDPGAIKTDSNERKNHINMEKNNKKKAVLENEGMVDNSGQNNSCSRDVEGCDDNDGDSENDNDTAGDLDSDAEEDYWDIDGQESDASSCETGESGLDWDELQELPDEWKQTLSRAARACATAITNLSEELSRKFYISHETPRTKMVKNISQGRLKILQKVQELIEA